MADLNSDDGDDTHSNELSEGESTSEDADASSVASPDPEYVKKVLDGGEALTKLTEALAILADCEVVLAFAEPLGGVLTIVTMIVNVWEALELPERTCRYQGLCYGLMYGALDMGDPQANPGWPGAEAAPEGTEHFADGLAQAKQRLADGQEGVKRRNLLLLSIAKNGESAVVNKLWQQAISDEDHLLKMFTVEWPNVGPNG